MILRPNTLHGLGVALAAFATVGAAAVVGPAALALPLLAVAAALVLARPAVAVAIAVGTAVVIEGLSDWGPTPVPSRIYDLLPGTKLAGIEALLLLAVVAAVLGRRARGLPILLPTPFSVPLGLLTVGLVAGAWTGRDAGVGINGIVEAARTAVPVVLVPFVVVQVVSGHQGLRRALALAGGLAAFKGVIGVLAYVGGFTAASVGQKITYYEAPANTVMLMFLCFGVAALLTRQNLPTWVWAALPFALMALTLSFRRSFWIAALLALSLVAIVAASTNSRRFGAPAALIGAVAVYLALAGGGGQLSGGASDAGGSFSLRSRLTSINPSAIAANREDRYRLAERRNVLAELKERPVSGLGLGVGYEARYPLSIGDITHEYVHFAALWWWMKLGILGLIGYLWLIGATVVAGGSVWRRHPDGVVRAAGLAAAAGIVGYAVAETTATFSGSDVRSSIVLGGLLGLLSVAWAQTPSARDLAS